MAAAAILDNFEWPYVRNGSRSTNIYSAHRAVIFAIAQLSCLSLSLNISKTVADTTKVTISHIWPYGLSTDTEIDDLG